jgi:hypothetical protein
MEVIILPGISLDASLTAVARHVGDEFKYQISKHLRFTKYLRFIGISRCASPAAANYSNSQSLLLSSGLSIIALMIDLQVNCLNSANGNSG